MPDWASPGTRPTRSEGSKQAGLEGWGGTADGGGKPVQDRAEIRLLWSTGGCVGPLKPDGDMQAKLNEAGDCGNG